MEVKLIRPQGPRQPIPLYQARGAACYNEGLAVFTPSMAKREGAVFAAAPVVQGKFTGAGGSDVPSFERGSVIAGNWHKNFDPYQGGGAVNFLPEQCSGCRAGLAYLWYVSVAYNLAYDYTNGCYALTIGTQTMTLIQAVVAGTVEYLAWGYDTRNKLDGTNYAYISRNDTQQYGIDVQPTVSTPGAVTYVGGGGFFPANGLIEGLTFYRRVLWTGTYGINLGNGDEVALIAAGKDPCIVTKGSWDIPFCLPTDSKKGALTTGEGEAWSHPHSSNLIPGNSNIGGFMTDGAYTDDGWVGEGPPSAVAALADAEKMFMGGYKTTSDAPNQGLYQDVTVEAGDDWVIRVLAHSDGTSVPRAIFYDQTNGAEIGHLDGTNTSTRTAPDVLLFAGEAPAGCVLLRVKLVNTQASNIVYWHQCELLDNLVTNPSLEVGAGNPWIPMGWANLGLLAGEGIQSANPHSGLSALRLVIGGAGGRGVVSNVFAGLADGNFISIGFWQLTTAKGMTHDGNGLYQQTTLSTLPYARLGVGPYRLVSRVYRASSGNPSLRFRQRDAANADGLLDDIYAFKLDDVSLTVTPASAANSVESGGLRVDGRDKLEQDITNRLKRTSGEIRWRSRPRHAPANLVAFVETANAYLIQAYGDATNYISVYGSAANTVTLAFNDGGGAHTVNWDCTAAWVADEELAWKLEYHPNAMRLWCNSMVVATIIQPVSFATIPNTIYFGRSITGDNSDTVIKEV